MRRRTETERRGYGRRSHCTVSGVTSSAVVTGADSLFHRLDVEHQSVEHNERIGDGRTDGHSDMPTWSGAWHCGLAPLNTRHAGQSELVDQAAGSSVSSVN